MGAAASVSPALSQAILTANENELKETLRLLDEETQKKLRDTFASCDEDRKQKPTEKRPITNGWDVHANKPIVVGYAPLATRPDWLPKSGPGQKNVDPLCWSLSVEQWIFFVRACQATDTWNALAEAKGEYNITMYDINEHFVKPWTQGTGCSIALLMNTAEQLPVEGMFSHAWAGSVVETHNCLQNMVNHNDVPGTARFFFCTFSMYQPQDGAEGGLSISEQIELEPFAKIIESEPTHGMFVLHTTLSEVYDRLWVAHEADVGIDAGLQIRGLFDMYRWTVEQFEATAAIKTCEGKVGVEKDREYIDGLIMQRGGYDRLDTVITEFRIKMLEYLKELIKPEETQDSQDNNALCGAHRLKARKLFDWSYRQSEQFDSFSREYPKGWDIGNYIGWTPGSKWKLESVANQLGLKVTGIAYPLGASSFPYGPPVSEGFRDCHRIGATGSEKGAPIGGYWASRETVQRYEQWARQEGNWNKIDKEQFEELGTIELPIDDPKRIAKFESEQFRWAAPEPPILP